MSYHIINRMFHKLAFIMPGGYNIRPQLHRMRGVTIGKNVWISQYVYIDELHPEAVTIGDDSSIGLRSSIFTNFYWGPRRSKNGYKEVVIEKDVYIGPHCIVLLGEGAVLKAGSVITRDVPSFTFMGPPSVEPLGRVTVPLTHQHEYHEFVRGLRPIRKKRVPRQEGGKIEGEKVRRLEGWKAGKL